MKIVFFSDIHANLPALEAFFRDIESVKPDAIYCLGDLVGYNTWANEVVHEIRKRNIPTIMGNHDEALMHVHISENKSTNRELTRGIVSEENRGYLTSLPRHLSLTFVNKEKTLNLLMVHGSVQNIDEYILEDFPEEDLLEMTESKDADILLCGHTHRPFHRILKRGNLFKHIINIGSVGKPKDGDPRACYAIMNLNQQSVATNVNSIEVTFRRVTYDVEKAARAVEGSPFDNAYADSLRKAK